MSTQLVKTGLNLFIFAALAITIVQQIMEVRSAGGGAAQQEGAGPVEPQLPKIPGVVIMASDNLRQPVMHLLKNNSVNISVKSYDFQGIEWWYETIIQNGHIFVVYLLFQKYQAETDAWRKKKILFIGLAVVMMWFYVLPNFKNDRIIIQNNGLIVYQNTQVNPNEIMAAIGDDLDLKQLMNDVEETTPEFDGSERTVQDTYNQHDIF